MPISAFRIALQIIVSIVLLVLLAPDSAAQRGSSRPSSGGSRPSASGSMGGSRPSVGSTRPSIGSSRPSIGSSRPSIPSIGSSRPSIGSSRTAGSTSGGTYTPPTRTVYTPPTRSSGRTILGAPSSSSTRVPDSASRTPSSSPSPDYGSRTGGTSTLDSARNSTAGFGSDVGSGSSTYSSGGVRFVDGAATPSGAPVDVAPASRGRVRFPEPYSVSARAARASQPVGTASLTRSGTSLAERYLHRAPETSSLETTRPSTRFGDSGRTVSSILDRYGRRQLDTPGQGSSLARIRDGQLSSLQGLDPGQDPVDPRRLRDSDSPRESYAAGPRSRHESRVDPRRDSARSGRAAASSLETSALRREALSANPGAGSSDVDPRRGSGLTPDAAAHGDPEDFYEHPGDYQFNCWGVYGGWNGCYGWGWGWWGNYWCTPFCNWPWWWSTPFYYCSYWPWYWGYQTVYVQSSPVVVYVEPEVIYVDGAPVEEVLPAGEVSLPVPAEPMTPGGTEVLPAGEVPLEEGAQLNAAAERYLELGDSAFQAGRYGDAVQLYAKAVELAPEVGVLYLILSDALFATGDYHYAAYTIRKALSLDPSLTEAVVDKHGFYGNPAEFDQQLAVLETYIVDHPGDGDALLVLATNYLFGSRPAAAVDLLRGPFARSLQADPTVTLVLERAQELQYGPPVESEIGQ